MKLAAASTDVIQKAAAGDVGAFKQELHYLVKHDSEWCDETQAPAPEVGAILFRLARTVATGR